MKIMLLFVASMTFSSYLFSSTKTKCLSEINLESSVYRYIEKYDEFTRTIGKEHLFIVDYQGEALFQALRISNCTRETLHTSFKEYRASLMTIRKVFKEVKSYNNSVSVQLAEDELVNLMMPHWADLYIDNLQNFAEITGSTYLTTLRLLVAGAITTSFLLHKSQLLKLFRLIRHPRAITILLGNQAIGANKIINKDYTMPKSPYEIFFAGNPNKKVLDFLEEDKQELNYILGLTSNIIFSASSGLYTSIVVEKYFSKISNQRKLLKAFMSRPLLFAAGSSINIWAQRGIKLLNFKSLQLARRAPSIYNALTVIPRIPMFFSIGGLFSSINKMFTRAGYVGLAAGLAVDWGLYFSLPYLYKKLIRNNQRIINSKLATLKKGKVFNNIVEEYNYGSDLVTQIRTYVSTKMMKINQEVLSAYEEFDRSWMRPNMCHVLMGSTWTDEYRTFAYRRKTFKVLKDELKTIWKNNQIELMQIQTIVNAWKKELGGYYSNNMFSFSTRIKMHLTWTFDKLRPEILYKRGIIQLIQFLRDVRNSFKSEQMPREKYVKLLSNYNCMPYEEFHLKLPYKNKYLQHKNKTIVNKLKKLELLNIGYNQL